MDIIVCLDERYVTPAGVMLHSLFAQHPGQAMRVHLLRSTDFDTGVLGGFAHLIRDAGNTFADHPVPQTWLDAIPENEHFPKTVWLKIFAPLLIEARRALMLDADVIVRDSLRDLWQMDLKGDYLAAVQDLIWRGSLRGLHAHISSLGLSSPERYFNNGVMLLDLEKMRQAGVTAALQAYAGDSSKPKRMPEQDAYNYVISGAWQRLPLRYNATFQVYLYQHFDVPMNTAELESARANPAIVHYCGPDKPWVQGCWHPYRADYHRHARLLHGAQDDVAGAGALHRAFDRLPLTLRVAGYRLLHPWDSWPARLAARFTVAREKLARLLDGLH